MVFISTLAVQLIIALFLSQIVHAVHAGIWFHAGIFPAVLQGTFDRLGVSRVLGHGGERQHVLHLQLAGLSTSMSVEVRAALVFTIQSLSMDQFGFLSLASARAASASL